MIGVQNHGNATAYKQNHLFLPDDKTLVIGFQDDSEFFDLFYPLEGAIIWWRNNYGDIEKLVWDGRAEYSLERISSYKAGNYFKVVEKTKDLEGKK